MPVQIHERADGFRVVVTPGPYGVFLSLFSLWFWSGAGMLFMGTLLWGIQGVYYGVYGMAAATTLGMLAFLALWVGLLVAMLGIPFAAYQVTVQDGVLWVALLAFRRVRVWQVLLPVERARIERRGTMLIVRGGMVPKWFFVPLPAYQLAALLQSVELAASGAGTPEVWLEPFRASLEVEAGGLDQMRADVGAAGVEGVWSNENGVDVLRLTYGSVMSAEQRIGEGMARSEVWVFGVRTQFSEVRLADVTEVSVQPAAVILKTADGAGALFLHQTDRALRVEVAECVRAHLELGSASESDEG